MVTLSVPPGSISQVLICAWDGSYIARGFFLHVIAPHSALFFPCEAEPQKVSLTLSFSPRLPLLLPFRLPHSFPLSPYLHSCLFSSSCAVACYLIFASLMVGGGWWGVG